MLVQTSHGRKKSGPLTLEDLREGVGLGFSPHSIRFLAACWKIEGQRSTGEIEGWFKGLEEREWQLRELAKEDLSILDTVSTAGGRLRGENLRRDLVLRGIVEPAERLRSWIERGYVIPVPNSGETDLDIERLLTQGAYLRRDLALLEVMVSSLGSARDGALGVSWSGKVHGERSCDAALVQRRLLHLSMPMMSEPVKLTSLGVPDRRRMMRFFEELFGVQESDIEEGSSGDFERRNRLSYLIALALDLGIICFVNSDTLRGDAEKMVAYFRADPEDRARLMQTALQSMARWSEIDSDAIGTLTNDSRQQHFSARAVTASGLGGLRGYLYSVFRRAKLVQWTPLKEVLSLAQEVDSAYLEEVLASDEDEFASAAVVGAVLGQSLYRAGLVEWGQDDAGADLVRLTPEGAMVLGVGLESRENTSSWSKSLVVQPNLEVMVFVDTLPLSVLHDLYWFCDRESLTDRVAVFRLTSASVQRGYGFGLSADEVIEILETWCQIPLSESILFQLRDWERTHRRISLHSGGVWVNHRDPDVLDTIRGRIEFDDPEAVVLSIGDSIFVSSAHSETLDRLVERGHEICFDYSGPCAEVLDFVESLVVEYEAVSCDVVTRFELAKFAERVPSKGRVRMRLEPDLIRIRWPEDTVSNVLAFLEPRTRGGMPAQQVLALRASFGGASAVRARTGRTLAEFEDASWVEIVLRDDELAAAVYKCHGDRVVELIGGMDEEFFQRLRALGIELS